MGGRGREVRIWWLGGCGHDMFGWEWSYLATFPVDTKAEATARRARTTIVMNCILA